jgi:RNA polymerase sigma-70 factor (ECF subfamily)
MTKKTDEWVKDIFSQYKNKILGYFGKRLLSGTDAEDLTSKVFLEITRCAERFDATRASASTWIFTICRNLYMRHLRDASTRGRFVKTGEDMQDIPDSALSDIDGFIRREELAGALEKLTADKRRVILLSYYYGYTPEEIAKKTNMTYTNVCTLKSRALDDLRKTFGEKK